VLLFHTVDDRGVSLDSMVFQLDNRTATKAGAGADALEEIDLDVHGDPPTLVSVSVSP
jgi:hypothetical protein